MIGALITFVVLFGLIKVFESKRDDLDNFNIATAAIVPILCAVLTQVLLTFLFPNPALMLVAPGIVLIGTTFALLWKNLDIPAGKSAAYTTVVALVNEGLAFVLYSPS